MKVTIDILYEQIRKIRDQFGDDKCWMDWHALFTMLPEGYTVPPRDIRLRLEDCERYQKCLDQCTEYVPPPRWVVGQPDKEGLWAVVFDDGSKGVFSKTALSILSRNGYIPNVVKSFGPIPEEP